MDTPRPTHLMLDDERLPPQDGHAWAVVRTVAEAVRWVKTHGVPAHIAFDNDLPRRLEGRHFAQWLVRVDMESKGRFLPAGFTFYVHSQNSVNGIQAMLDLHLQRRHRLIQRLEKLPSR